MKSKLAQVNQSVEKTLRLIEFLAQCESPIRLQEISKQVGMPASTTLRLLNTLYVNGYVNQDPITLRYSLSLKFTQIGSAVKSHISISGLANKSLIALSKKCNESSNIAIEQDFEVVYIDVINGPDGILRTMQQVGQHAPMHCDAIGKIFLSQYDSARIAEYLAVKGLPALTQNTIVSPEQLSAELEHVRAAGYAVDNEESEIGVCSIAAPIRDYTSNVIAGISLSFPSLRITPELISTLKNDVVDTALKISKRFAYAG